MILCFWLIYGRWMNVCNVEFGKKYFARDVFRFFSSFSDEVVAIFVEVMCVVML